MNTAYQKETPCILWLITKYYIKQIILYILDLLFPTMSSIGDFRLDICPTLSAPIGNDLLLYTLACASENTPEATVTCYTVEGPYYDCKTITEAPVTHDPNCICKSSCFRTRMADPNDRRGVLEISSIDAVSTTISAVSSRIISASSIIAVTSAASSTISLLCLL
jgi:hypothetical protein